VGVKEFQSAHLRGAAGEVLNRGVGLNVTEIHIGVAKFDSASDAAKVRSWMHGEDLQQPCFTQCVFSPRPVKLSGVPNSAAVQTTTGSKPGSGPANYRIPRGHLTASMRSGRSLHPFAHRRRAASP
jgi:hypothetical protein